MRHGRPEADRRNSGLAERVVEHTDDARRALVPRRLQAELLDEREIAGRAGDGRSPRVRDVGEKRPERHDELDAEVTCQADDEIVERTPAVVRLDAEQDHGVAIGTGDRRDVEGRSRATRSSASAPRRAYTVGRVDWKSTNPSGSISAKRLASQTRTSVPPASVAACPRRSSRGRPRSAPGGAGSAARRSGARSPSMELSGGRPLQRAVAGGR